LTWVFIFGNFKDGDVLLKNTQIQITARSGSAYAFLADREDHSLDSFIGERASIVNFTHKNVLQIPESALRFNLDPWLTHSLSKQCTINFDFQPQLRMEPKEKLAYVLKQTQMYHKIIENNKHKKN
jgi:hypothetical protein